MKLPISFLFCFGLLVGFPSGQGQNPECPPEETIQFPHPNCTIFIVCVNGIGSEMECPVGLYYIPDENICDFPENVPECVGGTRPPSSTEPTPTTTPMPTTSSMSTTVKTTNIPSSSPTPPETLTECGQIITANSGYIEYKLNQTYRAGELCTFVIRLQGRRGCDFILETHGIPNIYSDTISVIRVADLLTDLQTVQFGSEETRFYLDYAHFVVVFRTITNNGTGFRLQFRSRSVVASAVPGVQMTFDNKTENPVGFPIWPEAIGEYERDTVVITAGGKWLKDASLQLKVFDEFINTGCDSKYSVYNFEGTITKYEGRVCGIRGEKEITQFRTKGLFIVVFYKHARSTEVYLGALDWNKIPE